MKTPMIIVRSEPRIANTTLSQPIEIGLALDASGSMGNYAGSIITGFNTILEEQKALSHHTKVSLTLFNSTVQQVYNGVEIAAASHWNLPIIDAPSAWRRDVEYELRRQLFGQDAD